MGAISHKPVTYANPFGVKAAWASSLNRLCGPGDAPMGVEPHGSITVAPPGSHRHYAVAGPRVG